MTYPVLGIPNATDVPAQSQAQIQTNFNSIIGWGAVDHLGYGTANAGKHNQINFPNVTSQGVPSNPASVLYTANDAFTVPQLFFLNSANSGQFTAASNGSVQLFGGIILKWGGAGWPGQNGFVDFISPFPHFCFSVICQNANSGSNITYMNVTSVAANRFQVFSPNNSGGSNLLYIAIGN